MRLGFQQLSDCLGGRFHDSIEHVDGNLVSVIVRRDQTHAIGCINPGWSVVHIDADLGFAVFRVQQLRKEKRIVKSKE